jgi:hypothetical protein
MSWLLKGLAISSSTAIGCLLQFALLASLISLKPQLRKAWQTGMIRTSGQWIGQWVQQQRQQMGFSDRRPWGE